MKKWKWILTVVLLLVLLAALWMNACKRNRDGYAQTEYWLNTRCAIRVWNVRGESAEQAVQAAFEEVAQIHHLTDYYSDASDVSRINAARSGEAVAVDERTMAILNTALEICCASDGAFDITIAPVKDLWNFAGDPAVPDAASLAQALEAVDWRALRLDESAGTVSKRDDRVKIDLGGAAKGYAADRAAEVLREHGAEAALLDFGGNIVTMGKNPNTEGGEWRVGLQKPFAAAGEYDLLLSLPSGSVVTSGTYEQNFEQDGKRYHHILNPETGFPAEPGFDSVSVVHPSSLTADCLSTACFVLGEERGRALAGQYGAEIYFDSGEESAGAAAE